MAIILSIETSTSVCSAALHHDGILLAVNEIHTPQSAASQLAVQIEELFSHLSLSKKKLEAVAISAGPGSYTGLRIGIATAKGICVGLRVPLIAIDSLQVLASSVSDRGNYDLLCPMIDARRMEVYCNLLNPNLEYVAETQAKIIDSFSFAGTLSDRTILFFGNGAAKCRGVIQHQNASFRESVYASAGKMGHIAQRKFSNKQFEDVNLYEPNYLKNFVAKTKSA